MAQLTRQFFITMDTGEERSLADVVLELIPVGSSKRANGISIQDIIKHLPVAISRTPVGNILDMLQQTNQIHMYKIPGSKRYYYVKPLPRDPSKKAPYVELNGEMVSVLDVIETQVTPIVNDAMKIVNQFTKPRSSAMNIAMYAPLIGAYLEDKNKKSNSGEFIQGMYLAKTLLQDEVLRLNRVLARSHAMLDDEYFDTTRAYENGAYESWLTLAVDNAENMEALVNFFKILAGKSGVDISDLGIKPLEVVKDEQ